MDGRASRRSTAAAAAGGRDGPVAAAAAVRRRNAPRGLSLAPQAGTRAVRCPSAQDPTVACPRAASHRGPRLEPLSTATTPTRPDGKQFTLYLPLQVKP